ncbi:FecCD family ABC transporter permease [Natronosporangium hydrolyticum]|nr:iron ABC transporter permease [Natronosporangium hydrolyticum]
MRSSWVPATVVGVLLIAGTALASLRYGSNTTTDWVTVVQAFTDPAPTEAHIIIRELRAPRTLIGLGVGASLAVAGALMQALTRNPLADPGILGVNAGASLAVISAIYLLGISAPIGYVWFGFAGAAGAAVLVYTLGASGRGGMTPLKVTLAGAVLAALLGSVTASIMLLDERSLDQFRFWMVGSIAGRDPSVAVVVAPFMVAGLVIAVAASPSINVLVLGDDVARGLGQQVLLTRLLVGGAVVLLAGSAVAAAGPIGFLGLAVPHLVRMVTGPDYRKIIFLSLLYGPVILLTADIAGRLLIRPAELQVGIATALIGAPLFVALARRGRLVSV